MQGVTKSVIRSTKRECQSKQVTRDIKKIHTWHDQDHRQGQVGAHPAYSRHMPSGRVGVLFGFFSGPGGRASSEDTCPMGGWADGFLDRAPVGVARF